MNTRNKNVPYRSGICCAVLLGLANLDVSAGDDLVGICHYSDESDSWIHIQVAERAVSHHLAHHDDGMPGSTTMKTGTSLDYDCAEIVGGCPCDFSTAGLAVLNIDGVGNEFCTVASNFVQAVDFDYQGNAHVGILPEYIYCSRSQPFGVPFEKWTDLTVEDYEACRSDLLANAPPCAGK